MISHLNNSLKRLAHVNNTFPLNLLTFSDWLLREPLAPYDPKIWLTTVMTRAAEQFPPDQELGSLVNSCSYAKGCIDWQHSQQHNTWNEAGISYHSVRKRIRAITYGIGRNLSFDLSHHFEGGLWRLYTDGSVKGNSVACSAILYYGNAEFFSHAGIRTAAQQRTQLSWST